MINRREIIGASDVSSVLGVNPYKTPLQLWAEKTGRIEPIDLSDNEAIEWGNRLERVVSNKFSDKNNVKLMAYKARYVHQEYDFISCELDNIIVGTDELVEIKTCNAYQWKKWKNPDEMPSEYIIQVMTQLGLSKRKVGWIACLCGGQKYIEKRIDFDKEMYESIIRKCVEFWNMVKDGIPPPAMQWDDETLFKLHPSSDDKIQECEEINETIAYLQETKMHIKQMEEEQENLEIKIKEKIGDNLGILTSKYKVLWTPTKTLRIDTDKIKADGIYEKYAKQTESRRLTIKLNKKGE